MGHFQERPQGVPYSEVSLYGTGPYSAVSLYGTDPGEYVSRHVRDKGRQFQSSGDQSVGPARRADQDTLAVHDVVDIAN